MTRKTTLDNAVVQLQAMLLAQSTKAASGSCFQQSPHIKPRLLQLAEVQYSDIVQYDYFYSVSSAQPQAQGRSPVRWSSSINHWRFQFVSSRVINEKWWISKSKKISVRVFSKNRNRPKGTHWQGKTVPQSRSTIKPLNLSLVLPLELPLVNIGLIEGYVEIYM